MCHSCASRNPGIHTGKNPGNMAFYFLDSRLRGNDTLGLARRGRGHLLHSATMLRETEWWFSGKYPIVFCLFCVFCPILPPREAPFEHGWWIMDGAFAERRKLLQKSFLTQFGPEKQKYCRGEEGYLSRRRTRVVDFFAWVSKKSPSMNLVCAGSEQGGTGLSSAPS